MNTKIRTFYREIINDSFMDRIKEDVVNLRTYHTDFKGYVQLVVFICLVELHHQ